MKVSYRFVICAALFITCLITANIIVVKPTSFWGVPAAIVIFPLSYIVGDILTEVYGYRMARMVIWLGFLCNLIAVLAIWLGQILPPASAWAGQGDYESILGYTPKVLLASFLAYLVGEFSNSFILAKMKVKTKGRWLWSRTISSTIVAQALDAAVFIPLVYIGRFDWSFIAVASVSHWLAKVGYEILATPFTYLLVNHLKRKESIDVYDYGTKFTPFSLEVG